MKVFISWSGDRSKKVAEAVKDWLGVVLQYVEPFMSASDIDSGERWQNALGGQLQESNIGILCLTPENSKAPWIMFEAGALSKSVDRSKVIPLLFDMKISDLEQPLSQFNGVVANDEGIKSLLTSINNAAGTPDKQLREEVLNNAYVSNLATLNSKLSGIQKVSTPPKRKEGEILEDLVGDIRSLKLFLQESAYKPEDVKRFEIREKRLHPMMFVEMASEFIEEAGDLPVALCAIAGTIRDLSPLMYEVLIDAARELRMGGKSIEKVLDRIHRVSKLTRHPMYRDICETEYQYRISQEIAMVIDKRLHAISYRSLSARSKNLAASINAESDQG
jgi:hypothetical protein